MIFFENAPLRVTTALCCLLFVQMSAWCQEPDSFSDLKCIPQIPDPLVRYYQAGDTINIIEKWEAHRPWIKQQAQQWILGHLPPPPEDIFVEVDQELVVNGVIRREVTIRFGEGASIRAKLHIPNNEGPHPVFFTQWNHEGWAAIALQRGYATCVYAAADALDDTQNYGEIYPAYDFGDLMGRAYGAMRVLDYLHTLPEIDTTRVGITGHSRNGKQSLFVAAFDERIDAVVVSGGGVSPMRTHEYRHNPHDLFRTLVDFPTWFSPNLTKFVGKPHLLPVDFNTIFALVAPRACMVSSGLYDLYADSYGAEKSFHSVRSVYKLYNATHRADIRQTTSRHTVMPRDVEEILDFFDTQFERKSFPPFLDLWHTYDFVDWKESAESAPSDILLQARKLRQNEDKESNSYKLLKDGISLLLGASPHEMQRSFSQKLPEKSKTDHVDQIIRGGMTVENAVRIDIRPYNTFGNYQTVTLFLPEGYKDKPPGSLPSVLYLHDMSYSFGYAKKTYPGFSLSPMVAALVDKGFVVVTFDLPGFGSRQRELRHFYKRYPEWSLMGKMVDETQKVLAYMQQLGILDATRMHLLGNGLGGTVASLTDLRPFSLKHVLLINPFHQYYKVAPCFEGISHLSHQYGLIPRIGHFIDKEEVLPFTFDDLLMTKTTSTTVGFSTDSRHNDWKYLQGLSQRISDLPDLHFEALEHDHGIRSSDFKWILKQLQD